MWSLTSILYIRSISSAPLSLWTIPSRSFERFSSRNLCQIDPGVSTYHDLVFQWVFRDALTSSRREDVHEWANAAQYRQLHKQLRVRSILGHMISPSHFSGSKEMASARNVPLGKRIIPILPLPLQQFVEAIQSSGS